ncbi:hypothetical protein [Methylobrevis albus]|uniref:Uncharacterized protein n=1 Tax=Methylobrevis albus TaxID=2793297 RepID=A0A931I2E3_9HYPH|nr:hypothetical protein [Methylobrevis albus]MBH0238006.1 hypothetical protein [Methylobrevis albus]
MATSDQPHAASNRRPQDKVPFTDPAAAPLGTDDEAAGVAGRPAPRSDIRQSHGVRDPDLPDLPDLPGPPPGSAATDESARRIDGELLPEAKWRVRGAVAAFVGVIVVLGLIVIWFVAG